MSAFTEMPFHGVANEELIPIFPKEGDDYKGHIYSHGHWYKGECDGNFYNEYVDDYGRWQYIDYKTEDIGEWYYSSGGGYYHVYKDAYGERVQDDNVGNFYAEPIRRSLSWVCTHGTV